MKFVYVFSVNGKFEYTNDIRIVMSRNEALMLWKIFGLVPRVKLLNGPKNNIY